MPIKLTPLYRCDSASGRSYARVTINGDVVWYPSVTSVIHATAPTPSGLLQWYAKHGMEGANKLRDEAADYGTELHLLVGLLTDRQQIELASVTERMARDLMAWCAFAKERDVEIVYNEAMVYSETLGYAGAADIVCRMSWQGKTVNAIVDIKSGANSYPDHATQLEMYRLAWNECYGEESGVEVTHIFNWHPNDWKGSPTYKLINQTGKTMVEEIQMRCALYRAKNEVRPLAKTVYKGALPDDVVTELVQPEDEILAKHASYVGDDLQLTAGE